MIEMDFTKAETDVIEGGRVSREELRAQIRSDLVRATKRKPVRRFVGRRLYAGLYEVYRRRGKLHPTPLVGRLMRFAYRLAWQ